MYPARRLVVPEARGEVLEIGVGTGLNLPLYDPARVERVIGVDPDPHMLRRARHRAMDARVPVELHAAGAEHVPFGDDRFDTVVVTWVLCTVGDAAATLREVRRVLRPGGEPASSSTRARSSARSRRSDGADARVAASLGGCHLDRAPLEPSARPASSWATSSRRPRALDAAPVYHGTAVKPG
jgi:ubiquinone/menaquinone biosynthesis C-methylase UbiE